MIGPSVNPAVTPEYTHTNHKPKEDEKKKTTMRKRVRGSWWGVEGSGAQQPSVIGEYSSDEDRKAKCR